MRYCYGCGHTTPGEPLFCNSCGRSYDAKLCPRLHINPRLAEACSRCGNRDLSTPQPRVPLGWRIFAFLTQFGSGIFLGVATLGLVLQLLKSLRADFEIRQSQVILVLFFVALWSAWSILPSWFRRATYRSMQRTEEVRKSG